MDLSEWAHQFLIRNAKLKGWIVNGSGPEYTVESKAKQTYTVVEHAKDAPEANVLITLNTKANVRWVAEHFDEIPESRIIFANPQADGYWTLNIRMMRLFGDVDRFKKKPETFSTEVPLL